jgi:hypothetical protein
MVAFVEHVDALRDDRAGKVGVKKYAGALIQMLVVPQHVAQDDVQCFTRASA